MTNADWLERIAATLPWNKESRSKVRSCAAELRAAHALAEAYQHGDDEATQAKLAEFLRVAGGNP